jgi:hypothetical protein
MPLVKATREGLWARAPLLLQSAHFDQVDTECIEPRQQALQSGTVGYLAAQHCLDRCNARGEIFEIEQGLGRKNTSDTNLISGCCHGTLPW